MDKALIIVGAEDIGGTYTEHYRLVAESPSVSISYQGTEENHVQFLNEVADDFAENIAAHPRALEVIVSNGFKLESGHELKRIDHVGSIVVRYLSQRITQRITELSRGKALVIPEATN